jgi:PhnB protein
MKVNPYLNFNGDCAEALKFYERVLGGKIEGLMTFGEGPAEAQPSPAMKDKVLHARLVLGDQVLMASDSPSEYYEKPQGTSLALGIDKAADAERIFNALAEGGTVKMPFQKTFWAAGGFGMLVDRFGTPWMVNCEKGD